MRWFLLELDVLSIKGDAVKKSNDNDILVAIIMGSKSDWTIMQAASTMLDELNIAHEVRALSAHRTPDALRNYLVELDARNVQVIIAAAGGAAHLPGVIAAHTIVPVLGVPLPSTTFGNGLDALLSIVQMPAGIPVGSLAVGKPGAINAALMAASILGVAHAEYRTAIRAYREQQADVVLLNSAIKG